MGSTERAQPNPLLTLARAIGLWLCGRVHFPNDRVGEVVRAEEDLVIFRHVVVDPAGTPPALAGAVVTVRFHFARMPQGVNKRLSLIPTPLIVGMPGFRSKLWMWGQETGDFQGVYEWDSVAAAETYAGSLAMRLLRRRAAPGSLSYEITPT